MFIEFDTRRRHMRLELKESFDDYRADVCAPGDGAIVPETTMKIKRGSSKNTKELTLKEFEPPEHP